jgi:3-deoxy-7-phosphoheptulonate synthase
VEVHNDPKHALCDGQQSLTPPQFGQMMGKVQKVVDLMGKTVVY